MKSMLYSAALMAAIPLAAIADGGKLAGSAEPKYADSHAPIGVMGDHLHSRGEWMLSYRYMRMEMKDMLQGDDSIDSDDIVTQVANPYAPPMTVRVVPLEMTTDMHMLGMMYAPSDRLTLMAMLNYLEKSMNHQTYMGMMGANRLGQFRTEASGIGDTTLSALYGVYRDSTHRLHLNMGVSLPTGSIDEKDSVLTPMNTRPTLRLPYAMQLGSGTYDLLPGLTYAGKSGHWGWGAQYSATLRLDENDEDYSLGDRHQLTGWTSYRLQPGLSVSLRLLYLDEDSIDGRDPAIGAPVTTANPDNYGGERLDAALGVNWVGQRGALRGQRLALEYQATLDQDANGVQMEMQDMLTVGWQYAY